MDNKEIAKIVIEKLWALIGDKRVAGLSPYEAARKMGLLDEPAKLVDTLWDGPRPLPQPKDENPDSKTCSFCAGKGFISPLGNQDIDPLITCGACNGTGLLKR